VELTRVIDRLSNIAANLIPAGALTGKNQYLTNWLPVKCPRQNNI